ncbi:MAG: GxxExxY protein [Acidobacteria bacterium]|nr:GxxExxY protein [Acidobacteriota bacterium]
MPHGKPEREGSSERTWKHRALFQELWLRGVQVRTEISLPVSCKGRLAGKHSFDLLVEDRRFAPQHWAQCLNHLKASGFKIALLLNFLRPKVERGQPPPARCAES